MIHGQFFILDDFAAPPPQPGLFEIAYVTGGSGIRMIHGKKQKLTAGHYFLSEPTQPTVLQNLKDLSVIRFLFLSSFIDRVFPHCNTYKELAHSFLLRFVREIGTTFFIETLYTDTDNHVRSLVDMILQEESAARDGHLEMTRCYTLQIILHIFRQCSEKRGPSEFQIDHYTFIRTYDYCQKNFTKNIKLSDMCKNLHYSLPYLSARFKEMHGCTFTHLVQRFRVEEACRLLISGNKKINEIAALVGYSDVQSFFKVFKKHMGITPLQYRKQNIHFLQE